MKLIAQGAESEIFEDNRVIIKLRSPKLYRIPEIDQRITKSRTKIEARILSKLQEKNFNSPKLLKVEDNKIFMEKIDGRNLKDYLNDANSKEIMLGVGKLVRILHDHNLVHGDLTTMNFIVKDKKIFMIDFGLSFNSHTDEDKAVDLYVFEKALKCTHSERYSEYFYQGYGETSVLKKLKEIRRRGRKREEE